MKQQIEAIVQQASQSLASVGSLQALEQLRVAVLGKKGSLTGLLRGMGQVDPGQRPQVGQWINEARQQLEEQLARKEASLKQAERALRLQQETIDVTEPRTLPRVGVPHANSLVLDEVLDCFIG
ncbi:MAG: phenylalanine--tRNA ligase subunit alpha, partial [Clostridiales bacterium]|nr:phenylalanine--tRNA ligase subunit alpha [Clostridiales bacterium]